MKKIDRVQKWILFTIVAISLGISIWALIIANSDDKVISDTENTIGFGGLLFTIIGVVFSLYFVIIGINAHRIKNELVKFEEELEEEQKKIINNFGKVELDHQDTMYSHLLLQAKNIANANEREKAMKSLRLSRARLATKSKLLPLERRIQRMPDLSELGVQTDIEDLKKLIKDPTEDDGIKDLAIVIVRNIEDNLKNKQSNNTVPSNYTTISQSPTDTAPTKTRTPIDLLISIYLLFAAIVILIIVFLTH